MVCSKSRGRVLPLLWWYHQSCLHLNLNVSSESDPWYWSFCKMESSNPLKSKPDSEPAILQWQWQSKLQFSQRGIWYWIIFHHRVKCVIKISPRSEITTYKLIETSLSQMMGTCQKRILQRKERSSYSQQISHLIVFGKCGCSMWHDSGKEDEKNEERMRSPLPTMLLMLYKRWINGETFETMRADRFVHLP